MLISCHISVSPLLSTEAFTPVGDARARDTLALSLVPWNSSRQSKRKLPVQSVVSSHQGSGGSAALGELPAQGWRNEVIL